jgi:hypothetical protein
MLRSRLIALSSLIALPVVVGMSRAHRALGADTGPQAGSNATRGFSEPRCTYPDTTTLPNGPTVVSDFSDGVSSDGRGAYSRDNDGVSLSAAGILVLGQRSPASFWHMKADQGIEKPRRLSVNLSDPVPGGAGTPLGIADGYIFHMQWGNIGTAVQNFAAMKIGQRVTAAQTNLGFSINGRQHLLQMGPQPNGHCHDSTVIHGTGTSSATVYRASKTKWVVDLPAGSVGRLFDVDEGGEHAVDKGLYHIRLHLEVGK